MLPLKTLRKPVAIIHAYSMMSVLQRKIFNVLLYEVKQKKFIHHEGSVVFEHSMSFVNLIKAINFNSNNTKYLKEAIDGLASLKIEWNLLKDKAPKSISFLNLRILHGPPTFYQNGVFNFSFHKLMIDLMSNPAVYGSIDLNVQSKYESKYAHSLYENSTRFVNLNKRRVVSLITFKKLLGVSPDRYDNLRELNRNVILPSVEEVNDRSDFLVNIKKIKTGKMVTGFEWSVDKKETTLLAKDDKKKGKEKVIKLIGEYFGSVSKTIIDNIISSYSEEYILEKIYYTKEKKQKDVSGYYPIPYFISALRDDYKVNSPLKKGSSIEEGQSQSSHVEKEWCRNLSDLKSDLAHWQKHLAYAKESSNLLLKNTTQKVIMQCKEKIRKHFIKKPESLSQLEIE